MNKIYLIFKFLIIRGYSNKYNWSFLFPFIGAIIGLIMGSYFMTYYNEKNLGRSSQEASEIAISTTLGYLIGKFMKSLLIIISLFYLFLY